MPPKRPRGARHLQKAVERGAPQNVDPADLYGALDLGTNSCRMLIAQPKGNQYHVVDSFSKSVQLGAGLENSGRLSRASMNRTISAMRICREKLKRHRVEHMRLVATEACRRALSLTPTIVAMRQRYQEIVKAELERTLPRRGGLSAKDKKALDKMAGAIVNKLLHAPMPELKASNGTSEGPIMVAAAQRLFAPDQASGGLVELAPVAGSVVSLVAVDLPSLTGGASMLPVAGTQLPNGEIWISDLSANAVFRLDRSATTYLGAIPVVLDQPRQLVPYSGGVLLANGGFDGGAPGPGRIHLDAQGQIVAFFATTQPFGLLPFELAGVDGYLYTEFGFRAVTFADASNLALQTMFAPVGGAAFTLFPEDLAQRANGNVRVASFISPSGIYELDPSGQVVQ